jgi:hypothetical protein
VSKADPEEGEEEEEIRRTSELQDDTTSEMADGEQPFGLP